MLRATTSDDDVSGVGSITLITGIMAAGKSSIAQALAERLTPSVHLRGDVFRRMVINGREEMTGTPSAEALRQLELRYRLAVDVARSYYNAGFHVVYQDNVLGPWLSNVVGMFGEIPVDVVVLCPRADVVVRRESGRGKTGYVGFTVEEMDRGFRDTTPRIGRWIDTSDLTIGETVDIILG
jgi:chloramphenicol 3-O-phosphotransferase